MIYYYLDSSVWVKRHFEEAGSKWIRTLFSRAPTLGSSTLGIVEITAALSRKNKAGELSVDLNDKLEEVEEEWQSFFHIQFDEDTLLASKQIARQYALRGADAIHVASALRLKNQLDPDDQLALVSSDHELLDAANQAQLALIDPVTEETQSALDKE
ncbi:MAG: type II toxin-antitoxin system VapC family toxin [Chloroflexi bacterium]|nr:type II toxin-antitoxin system VapC family toxin [Chloroflexota bacterium]